MSRDDAHPALHTPPIAPHIGTSVKATHHFVPEGWEDLNRGICPCGEVVVWDEATDAWVPDRTMRVIVLTGAEAHEMAGRIGADQGITQFERQLDLQDEVEKL